MEQIEVNNDTSSQEETLGLNLQQEVALALGRSPQDIEIRNLHGYLDEKHGDRFLRGFTPETDKHPAGFFKMSINPSINSVRAEESKKQLAREWNAAKLAQAIGVPSVRILNYKETESGKTILELEQLDSKSGTFIPAELVETADTASIYGINIKRIAKAIMTVSGKEIPPEVSTDGVNDGDARNKSLESFSATWHESDIIFESKYTDVVSEVIPPEELKQISDTALSELTKEIPKHLTPDKKYFVHNDAAPNNFFILDAVSGDKAETLFLDLEWSGFTTNKFLAQLTDCGNLYGRLWANIGLQQMFIKEVIDTPTKDSLEYRYKLAKASIVFGTIYLAKYGIDPNNPEHQMSVKLLESLKENLAFLDTAYKTNQTDSHSSMS